MDNGEQFIKKLEKKAQHTCPKCGGKAYEAGFPGGVAVCLDAANCGYKFGV